MPRLLSVHRVVVLRNDDAAQAQRVLIAWSKARPEAAGRYLDELAAADGLTLDGRIDALQPAGAIYFSMDEADVQRVLAFPGTFVDIELYMPYHVVCRLKGIVRRTVKTALSVMKNGMGIEIIERDEHYLTLVKTISQSSEELQEGGEGGEGPERQEPEEAAGPDKRKSVSRYRSRSSSPAAHVTPRTRCRDKR